MQKLLILFLMAICPLASANWFVLFPSDEYMYFYKKHPKREGERVVKMWSAFSYYHEQSTSAGKMVSYINFSAFDCQSKKVMVILSKISPVRFTASNFYSYDFEQRHDTWTKIRPRSLGDFEWKLACQNE